MTIVGVPIAKPEFSLQVYFLHKGRDAGPFTYFQARRRFGDNLEKVAPNAVSEYLAIEHLHAHRFEKIINRSVDAIVSPPSRYPEQASAYRNVIASRKRCLADLTDRFFKKGSVLACHDASFQQVLGSFEYRPNGDEAKYNSLMIVDDTLRSGVTAAAIIAKLRQNGLREDCELLLACPLWLEV